VLTTGAASRLMDDNSIDGILVAIWAFIFGGIYGIFGYFALGALLYGSVRALGSQGSYRRARHVLAFACVPVALSLVLWPVKLALYGGDWFRSGGSDTGTGGAAFDVLTYAFFVWAAVLLVIGVRSVHVVARLGRPGERVGHLRHDAFGAGRDERRRFLGARTFGRFAVSDDAVGESAREGIGEDGPMSDGSWY
jgi:hypothetical protein